MPTPPRPRKKTSEPELDDWESLHPPAPSLPKIGEASEAVRDSDVELVELDSTPPTTSVVVTEPCDADGPTVLQSSARTDRRRKKVAVASLTLFAAAAAVGAGLWLRGRAPRSDARAATAVEAPPPAVTSTPPAVAEAPPASSVMIGPPPPPPHAPMAHPAPPRIVVAQHPAIPPPAPRALPPHPATSAVGGHPHVTPPQKAKNTPPDLK